MERKHLKKEIRKLLGDYVGIRLRENEFDPRGQRQSTFLDDMVHYNLAFSVALLWLSDLDAQTTLTREKRNFAARNRYMYPNRIEREAMILSSYAGILMNSIPIEEIFKIYSMRPSATHWQSSANEHWIQPFKISLHPFAMLTAPEAAEYTWKQSIKYQTATAYQKTNTCSARRAKKDSKQLDSLTRGKQQVDKVGLKNAHKPVKLFLQLPLNVTAAVAPQTTHSPQSPSCLPFSARFSVRCFMVALIYTIVSILNWTFMETLSYLGRRCHS
ncbi:uncharacterized protein C2orf80 homolog isoform X1 [Falco cherrug]|uniref:uncharacterized protein C2orf80 homolog isoform X1 n=2 Tax=Falco TaxID=8952 RepID=UPI002478D32D|nr:uncharacterized protein C2orf80 homolog isoform X1 [Falco cherrug]